MKYLKKPNDLSVGFSLNQTRRYIHEKKNNNFSVYGRDGFRMHTSCSAYG